MFGKREVFEVGLYATIFVLSLTLLSIGCDCQPTTRSQSPAMKANSPTTTPYPPMGQN